MRRPRTLCSIQVQNPSGGSSFSGVTTDSTLAGNGTSGSPLGVKSWPVAGYADQSPISVAFTCTANQLQLFVLYIPYEFRFSKFTVWVNAGDAVNNSDLGLYNSSGTLIADVGAGIINATGNQTFNAAQGAQTLSPGFYAFAETSAGSTFGLDGNSSIFSHYYNANYAATSGGALPSTITFPTLAAATKRIAFMLF